MERAQFDDRSLLLGHEWRTQHVQSGDQAIAIAENYLRPPFADMTKDPELAAAWAAIAQAHYAAANVRERPRPS